MPPIDAVSQSRTISAMNIKPTPAWQAKETQQRLNRHATEWLRQNDPQYDKQRQAEQRQDRKAAKQAKDNPRLVYQYARAMHLR